MVGALQGSMASPSLMMPRTIEPLEVTLFPDDCDREAQASDTMMVMNGDGLPEVLLDNEMMAQLDIVVDTVNMTASYRAKPYDDSDTERIQITLMRPEEAYGQLATGASGSTAVWPLLRPTRSSMDCVALPTPIWN